MRRFCATITSAAAIVAIIATALRLIPHNLLKNASWPVFSAYSSCHMSFLFQLLSDLKSSCDAGVTHSKSASRS